MVEVMPTIAIEPLTDAEIHQADVRGKLQELPKNVGVVFSSQQGIRHFVRLLKKIGHPLPKFNEFVAAVGQQSARLWGRYSRSKPLFPTVSGAKGLLESIAQQWPVSQVGHLLIPTALHEGDELVVGLRTLGIQSTLLPSYKTRRLNLRDDQRQRLIGETWDALLFFSPSAVEGIVGSLDEKQRQQLTTVQTVAIGHSTAAALKKRGFSKIRIAAGTGTESLLDVIDGL